MPATYAAWAPSVNGQPVPVFMLLPDSDFDGDGQVNAMEFAFRSDPFAPNLPPTPALHHEGGSIIISLPEFRSVAEGVRMVFETSSDMVSWDETAAEKLPLSTPGQTRYRLLLSANPERLFVRAAVKFAAEVL